MLDFGSAGKAPQENAEKASRLDNSVKKWTMAFFCTSFLPFIVTAILMSLPTEPVVPSFVPVDTNNGIEETTQCSDVTDGCPAPPCAGQQLDLTELIRQNQIS